MNIVPPKYAFLDLKCVCVLWLLDGVRVISTFLSEELLF